ncbi:thiamine ABC transporter permease [Photobacterium jeanii]|uniref:Thiamine ABC transporter permease n=1 Tax=Photobacterium jeanii TaxID=858640 RepID=A0A178KK00_9GAMM|nr:thiamine ABC transporter permease [Photobacterium jeanii]OAN17688.1 thiamine ABC transporter permease [Photobacterium jeanii]PST92654.1 thiamine ABC transporter permease [Photobacterium jeanii]
MFLHLLFFSAIALCILPLLPGMAGIILPALSWLPHSLTGTTANAFSLHAFELVITWPGIEQAIGLSLFTGISSSLLALLFTFLILQAHWQSPRWQRIERWLAPVLAMPHVAFAIGFGFLFASTGWLYRLVEQMGFSTQGWDAVVQDPYGLGLILALAIKETPFLLLMSASVLKQIKVDTLYKTASGLGYRHADIWLKVILPQWLPKIRLPFYAVLAFGLSVVDVSLIIGPTRPPTFAVLVWQWFNEPDLTLLPRAAAGALSLLALTLLVLLTARVIEHAVLNIWNKWLYSGANQLRLPGKSTIYAILLLPLIVTPLLVLWSIAQRWRFPDLLPTRFSFRFWQQELAPLWEYSYNSLLLAVVSSVIALVIAIGCLEYRDRFQRQIPFWLITIPMVIPQLSLLFGLQVTSHLVAGQHFWLLVSWSHVIFVFPYIYLALDGPWRSFDRRLTQSALSLGLSQWHAWWQVKRALLMPSIWIALAIGMSVSLAQYLPTQMLGAGRISTITTEAVALASGQDRRVSAIYGLLQAVLPLIFFSLALVAGRCSGVQPCKAKPTNSKAQRSQSIDSKSMNPKIVYSKQTKSKTCC